MHFRAADMIWLATVPFHKTHHQFLYVKFKICMYDMKLISCQTTGTPNTMKTWIQQIKEDMSGVEVSVDMVQDRTEWKRWIDPLYVGISGFKVSKASNNVN